MTTALVLAAGLGTRLRAVTSGPKWLVPVGDTTPMDEQLAALAATDSVDRVVAVVSGDTTGIRARLESLGRLDVELVDNADAHRWNNWSSALIGLDHIGDDSVVLLNSDLFARRSWLAEGLATIVETPSAALLIDGEKELTDEAMRVAGEDSITAIGKVGVDDPVGEYVGMAWWPRGTARSLRSILDGYRHRSDAAQNWYEHGIDADIVAGTRYARVATPSSEWVEIDNEADHRLALRLVDPPAEPARGAARQNS